MDIIHEKTVRELLYGFIVIFLLLLVFEIGQMQAQMTIDYVQRVCPSAKVYSYSPFTGLSWLPNYVNHTIENGNISVP